MSFELVKKSICGNFHSPLMSRRPFIGTLILPELLPSNALYTVHPEYFVSTKLSYPGDLRTFIRTHFHTAAGRCLNFSYAFHFCTEAAAHEIYEYKMHTNYYGFTVVFLVPFFFFLLLAILELASKSLPQHFKPFLNVNL